MYSDDLARWLFKILINSNTSCPIYNVGSDNNIFIDKIAKILGKKYGVAVNIPRLFNFKKDNYIPDIYKAKKELNLKNKYTSIQAVIKTIELCKKNYSSSM